MRSAMMAMTVAAVFVGGRAGDLWESEGVGGGRSLLGFPSISQIESEPSVCSLIQAGLRWVSTRERL